MKNNKFDSRNIPIKDLHLWDENPRFPDKYFKSSEEDLIKYFVTKKELKIIYFLRYNQEFQGFFLL